MMPISPLRIITIASLILLLSGPIRTQSVLADELPNTLLQNIEHQLRDREKPEESAIPIENITEIADYLIRFQRADGGWVKNLRWRMRYTDEQVDALNARKKKRSTLDNGTTYTHLHFLSMAYQKTNNEIYKNAARKALHYILDLQHPVSGGWRGFDTDAITYNDDVMAAVMELLRWIQHDDDLYGYLTDQEMKRVKEAYQRGLACILRTQLEFNGKKAVWGQQHHHKTGASVKARTYEHPSFTANESVGVVYFLMKIENPSQEIIDSIEGAVQWLEQAAITDKIVKEIPAEPITFRGDVRNFDRVLVKQKGAPRLWARFYDLKTGEPYYARRDGQHVKTFAEVNRERRTGYSWHGYWPEDLLSKYYPIWKAQFDQ